MRWREYGGLGAQSPSNLDQKQNCPWCENAKVGVAPVQKNRSGPVKAVPGRGASRAGPGRAM